VNELTDAFKLQCKVMDDRPQMNGGAQYRGGGPQGYHGGGRDNRKRRYRGKFSMEVLRLGERGTDQCASVL
jgi:hypothetical protein